VTAYKLTFGIESEEFVGHVAHCSLRFCFGLLPPKSSEAIKLWLVSFRTRVTLNQIESFNRNVQLCVVGIEEQHELACPWTEVERLQAAKSSDAMVNVNDEIFRT